MTPLKPSSCDNCGACCLYLKIEAQVTDTDTIRWLNLHENITYKDGFLYIFNKCQELVNGKCLIYEDRPKMCRLFKKGCSNCLEARKLFIEADT